MPEIGDNSLWLALLILLVPAYFKVVISGMSNEAKQSNKLLEQRINVTSQHLSDHIAESGKVNIEVLKFEHDAAIEELKAIKRWGRWVGNALHRMALKVGVDLPDPPV